jgi:hypothetical protein
MNNANLVDGVYNTVAKSDNSPAPGFLSRDLDVSRLAITPGRNNVAGCSCLFLSNLYIVPPERLALLYLFMRIQ